MLMLCSQIFISFSLILPPRNYFLLYLGEEMSCRSGGLPKLHVLKVWKLIELKEWTVEEGAMPCLRELEIRACKRLERLNWLREVTTLKQLILTNMPSHFATDVKESTREDVFIKENEWKPCPLLVSFLLYLCPCFSFKLLQFSFIHLIVRLAHVFG